MSIERNTTTVLQQDPSPFTTMFNDVLQGITNTAALGVYCYLASKPSGWKISKKELQKHFNCGPDHIQTCINHLKAIGVLEVIAVRKENGHFGQWIWNLKRHIPTDCTIGTTTRETHSVVNTPNGESDPINKRDIEIKDINKSIAKNKKFDLTAMLENNPHEIEAELIEQWLVNRKRFPVNRAAWDRINRVLNELKEKGVTAHDAFERMVASCWRSLEVNYFHQELATKPALKYPTQEERAVNEKKIKERELKAQYEKRQEIQSAKGFAQLLEHGKIPYRSISALKAQQEAERVKLGMTTTQYHEFLLSSSKK